MWGFNHIMFLPMGAWTAYLLGGMLLMWLLWGRLPDGRIDSCIKAIGGWTFEGPKWHRGLLSVLAVCVFAVARVPIHLLGDGYTCLATFGQGEAYIHKWAEPGSIWLIRQIQASLGGYTPETAYIAFAGMSVMSGGVFVWSVLALIGELTKDAGLRLLALSSVLLGGSALLFMGYVEFYAPVWAASAVFILAAIRYLNGKVGIWLVVLALVLSVLMHVEAVVFLPALGYLLMAKVRSSTVKRVTVAAACLTMIAGVATFVWLYQNRIEFEVLILPILQSRPEYPGYTFFSMLHVTDLLNEIALVVPNGLVLIAALRRTSIRRRWNRMGRFLLIASVGSLSFFMLFAAATTMGRDWDVMALSLLCPVLLVFQRLRVHCIGIAPRFLLANVLVLGLVSGAFFTVAHCPTCTEARFRTLLTEYNWNGWIILSTHYEQTGQHDQAIAILREMERRVPDRRTLLNAYAALDSGQVSEAADLADGLLRKDSYNPHFMQLEANVLRKQKRFDEAELYYLRALKVKPYHAPLMNELAQLYIDKRELNGAEQWATKAHTLEPEKTFITETLALVYIKMQDYTEATALADSLFLDDPHSAGAHLIKMTVALNRGDYDSAGAHYRAYLLYGKGRSDYERIREHYKGLSE
ncbi:tetratricopeptide repeat protein [bacterium]|nr:tetratricopeptide repeat protein [bacterium]